MRFGERLRSVFCWLDSSVDAPASTPSDDPSGDDRSDRVDLLRCIPFIGIHLACLGVIWVGFSWAALSVAVVLYVVRMFFITAFYHRYFSHRSFRTSRAVQLIGAFLGCTSGQRGPLWWAAHHRHHHKHSDAHDDCHSPRRHGFLYSHMGWFMTPKNFSANQRYVCDWSKYPELRFLDRYDWLPPLILAIAMYVLGAALAVWWPTLGTNAAQMVVWGFFVSTVVLYHATYTINSIAHTFGSRRFNTADDSRNNVWLALFTLGEGWHNNHHYYSSSVRQGFYWWEIDITFYVLAALAKVGLIWDVRTVPRRVLESSERRVCGASSVGTKEESNAV